jgi:hypothetical protein
MTKALAAAISALALIQIATPAVARTNDLADQRIERLLRELATKDAATATATPVTRTASVKVVGTIRRVSQIKLPLTCTMFLSDRNGHNEEKTGAVTFNGTLGTCTVEIPFRWANTDPDGVLDVNVGVSNVPLGGILVSAAAASDVSRSSDFGFPLLPLPKQNTTTQLTFDIRL